MADCTWHKLLDGVGSNDPGNPTEHGRNSERLYIYIYIYIEGTKTKHTNIERERERERERLVSTCNNGYGGKKEAQSFATPILLAINMIIC
jgi:hypothetical protein